MSDVFISYSRENQEVVRRLAEAVKRLGYDVWWDDQLPPHLSYGDVISQKVGGAKAAIVVWSANAAQSEWVRAEADMARNQKKLIQTSIDGRDPPMPFNQLHYVSLADWDGSDDHPGWSKVKESLFALCGPPGAEAAIPAVAAAAPVPVALAKPAPPPAPAPAPPPPPAAAPPPARRGSNKLLVILIGVSLLVIVAVAVLALTRRSAEPGGNGIAAANEARPADSGTPAAPAQMPAEFSQEAMISDEEGYTNVRSGPSADAPVVARVNTGETFNTYAQDGAWWRVRIAGGLVGYMERSRIRVREPVAVPSLVDGAPTAPIAVPAVPPPRTAPPPRRMPPTRPPKRTGPRLNEDNAGILRDFCMDAGAGTPECRRVGLGGRRRRY
ncbi:MAG: hypothetical protein QOD42_1767 [Sphingomonadales bacterium]|nr:hypothetical protein [Sphingomonadales bacterium]